MDTSLWEIILVLNGCKNPWLEKIQQYITNKEFTSIRLFQTDEPGVSSARNIGLNWAKGEYITFIDDDDIVSNEYLEKLSELAQKDTIAISYTIAFSEKESYIPYYLEKEYKRCANKGKMPFIEAKKFFGGPCMKLIHRSIIGDSKFDCRFKNGEDSLFMFLISNKFKYIEFTDSNAIYYRRIRQESASHTSNRLEIAKNGWFLVKQYHHIFYKGNGYSFLFFITRILGIIHSLFNK